MIASQLPPQPAAGGVGNMAASAINAQDSYQSSTDNDPDMRASSGSPMTHITELGMRPDITMFCETCRCQIDLRHLTEHRNYHQCLQTMKYRGSSRPECVEKLMQRRQNILRHLKKSTNSNNPLDPRILQKINEAYEFLKADLEDTFEAYRRIRDSTHSDVSGIGLNCSADCALAVGICSSGNDRWKSHMEDTRVFQDYFGNDAHKSFFAIYDGHHGTFAAEMAAEELHHALLLEMTKFDPRTKCACTANNAQTPTHPSETPLPLDYCEIHSRSPSKSSKRAVIYQESSAMIQKIIQECEEKLAEMEESKPSDKNPSDKKKRHQKLPFWEKMCDAFVKAHLYTDLLLVWGREEHSRVRWSGCSTLAVVIQDTLPDDDEHVATPSGKNEEDLGSQAPGTPRKAGLQELGVIHLANTGNVRGLLIRGNRPYCLSKEHTAWHPRERARVQKLGGTISENDKEAKINGILTTTRGLGNHGDMALKKLITPKPHTNNTVIDQYAQFLILASNGVWEVFSDREATSLLLQMIPSNHLPPPSQISTSIDYLLSKKIQEGPASRPQSVLTVDITAATELIVDQPAAPPTSNVRPPSSKTTNMDAFLASSAENKPSTPKYAMQDASSMVDMTTEAGSHLDEMSDDGDVDTYTELSLPDQVELGAASRNEFLRHYARAMSERLTQAALLAGAHDNVTVMVVLLPGCGL